MIGKYMHKDSFFLLFSAVGVFLVILIDEESNRNLSNIFRPIIVFHFGLISLWVLGSLIKSFRLIALWSLFIFYTGIALWRAFSIFLIGMPNFMIMIYLLLEIFGSAISLLLIKGMKKNKYNFEN